jgi:hypothetical protein
MTIEAARIPLNRSGAPHASQAACTCRELLAGHQPGQRNEIVVVEHRRIGREVTRLAPEVTLDRLLRGNSNHPSSFLKERRRSRPRLVLFSLVCELPDPGWRVEIGVGGQGSGGEPDRVSGRRVLTATPFGGPGLKSSRRRNGVQAHRVRTSPLAPRQRTPPRRSGPRRSPVRKGETRRTTRPIRR